jgi:hypothetical protein
MIYELILFSFFFNFRGTEEYLADFKKASREFNFFFHKKTFKSSFPFVKKAQSRLKALSQNQNLYINFCEVF